MTTADDVRLYDVARGQAVTADGLRQKLDELLAASRCLERAEQRMAGALVQARAAGAGWGVLGQFARLPEGSMRGWVPRYSWLPGDPRLRCGVVGDGTRLAGRPRAAVPGQRRAGDAPRARAQREHGADPVVVGRHDGPRWP